MLSTSRWRRFAVLSVCVAANVVVGVLTLSMLRTLTRTSHNDDEGGAQQSEAPEHLSVSQSSAANLATYAQETDQRTSRTWRRRKHDDLTYAVLLEPADAAQGRYCSNSQTLLIAVCSAVVNVDRRKAIRSTWGDATRLNALGARIVFFVARTDPTRSPPGIDQRVTAEYQLQGDVVQVDFIDDYVNLTAKTLAALRWATRACSHVRHVMKSDDDVYVDVEALTSRLEQERTTQRSTFGLDDVAATSFIVGQVVDSARPVRDRRSKWYTPTSIYSPEFYPPYASGTGYVVGASVVRRLVAVLDDESTSVVAGRPFWLEDVFVTGMLAARLPDVRLVHDARFNFRLTQRRVRRRRLPASSWRDDQDEEACLYRDAITVHDLTPSELVNLWKRLQQDRDGCTVDDHEQLLDDEEDLYSDTLQ